FEPARTPPAFTLRSYCRHCISMAWRNTGICWRGLEPSPQLGMGVSCGHYCNAGFGSLVNAAKGDSLRGGVGSLLSGALLYFLLRPNVREVFTRQPSENAS